MFIHKIRQSSSVKMLSKKNSLFGIANQNKKKKICFTNWRLYSYATCNAILFIEKHTPGECLFMIRIHAAIECVPSASVSCELYFEYREEKDCNNIKYQFRYAQTKTSSTKISSFSLRSN